MHFGLGVPPAVEGLFADVGSLGDRFHVQVGGFLLGGQRQGCRQDGLAGSFAARPAGPAGRCLGHGRHITELAVCV